MFFSKEEKKRGGAKASWVVGALAFIGAAGIVNKGRKLISGACCKMKEVMHREE